MTDQTLGDNCAVFREPVLKICSNGVIPVDVAWSWATGPRRLGQRPAHCLAGLIDQTRFDVRKHLCDHLARCCASLVRQHRIELNEQRHHVNVGLNRLQHLRFEKQLLQVESLDRVALHNLHHRSRKVGPNIAKPAHHSRLRPSEPASPVAATSFALRTGAQARIVAVIEGPKDCIDSFVITTDCWR